MALPQSATQTGKTAQQNADYAAGLRAGQAYAERTPGDGSQEERAKAKSELLLRKSIGFAYEAQAGEPQSEGESAARQKRKLEEEQLTREERNMTPEQAAAIYKLEYWDKLDGDQIALQPLAEILFAF